MTHFLRPWQVSVLICAILLSILVSAPHIIHTFDDRYEGIPVHLNSDEHYYLPRVQEVLQHGWDHLGTAIAGGEEVLPPLQAGLLERAYGVVFRPFTRSASTVFIILDAIVPFLFFLVLTGFIRSLGFSRRQTLVIAILFCALELYNLGRPLHQRESFLLVLLCMWGLIEGLRGRLWCGILGGALMGLLVGVYFWSFTAAWVYYIVVSCSLFVACPELRRRVRCVSSPIWGSSDGQSSSGLGTARRALTSLVVTGEERGRAQVLQWLLFGGVGVVCALPFVWGIYQLQQHPLYSEVFFRSGIGHSRVPESVIWSGLFGVMALGSILIFLTELRQPETKNQKPKTDDIYVVSLIATAFILLNQHLVHGTLFLFASHYLFSLVLAAVVILVWAFAQKHMLKWIVIGSSAIFLLGIAVDGRSVIAQWRIDDADFGEQHLATALQEVHDLDRATILSDRSTSALLASHTHHDVLYTNYLQHEMRSHLEITQRLCLVSFPLPRESREFAQKKILIYGAAYDAIYTESQYEEVRGHELSFLAFTCETTEENLDTSLDQYAVSFLLWDERRQPEWDPDRIAKHFTLAVQGEGWSLWERRLGG